MRVKKALSAVLSGTMAAGLVFSGLSVAPVTQAMAEEAATASVASGDAVTVATQEAVVVNGYKNPVYDPETDTTEWDYVYFGSYPKTEVKGDELTDAIKKAEYDGDNVAEVDGVKYKRLNLDSVTYSYQYGTTQYKALETPVAEGEFFKWNNKKEYRYFKFEPIKWRVLESSEEGQLFLMADNAVDCVNYMPRNHKVTWYISELRSFLNEYSALFNEPKVDYSAGGFLSMAFSEDEKKAIVGTQVYTENNNYWDSNVNGMPDSYDANAITDKIYIPSAEEVTNVEYGFAPVENFTSKTRQIDMSDYAFARGGWAGSPSEYQGNCWWLLRSPGDNTRKGALVYRDGRVYKEGYQTFDSPYYCTVPVCHVAAKSEYVVKVTEEPGNSDTPTPTPSTVPSIEPTTSPNPGDVTQPAVTTITVGDVDNNKKVELADAQLTLKMALKIVKEDNKKAADVDGNGKIELADAQFVLKFALKIIKEFPIGNTVEVSGASVAAATILYTEAPEEVQPSVTMPADNASGHIWIAGDSIAAQHGNGETYVRDNVGWGVIIGKYFSDDVVVHNTALSSRSSKSFVHDSTADKQYQNIMDGIKAGDYLMISFGHNDEYPTAERYTDPYASSDDEGSYKWYLKNYYIEPAMEKGAIPVLISSVVERNYVDDEFHYQFHSVYKIAMEELVAEYAEKGITIPYIDLQSQMAKLYEEDGLGKYDSELLHGLYLYADEDDNMKLTMDNTHFTIAGARYATKYILQGLTALGMDIMKFADNNMIATLDSIALLEECKVDNLDEILVMPAEDDTPDVPNVPEVPEVSGDAVQPEVSGAAVQ